jgi:hypothetical protein
MPVIEGPAGPGSGAKKDLGAAIVYVTQNAGALSAAIQVLVGFFSALFSKKRVGLLSDTRCPFCGR